MYKYFQNIKWLFRILTVVYCVFVFTISSTGISSQSNRMVRTDSLLSRWLHYDHLKNEMVTAVDGIIAICLLLLLILLTRYICNRVAYKKYYDISKRCYNNCEFEEIHDFLAGAVKRNNPRFSSEQALMLCDLANLYLIYGNFDRFMEMLNSLKSCVHKDNIYWDFFLNQRLVKYYIQMDNYENTKAQCEKLSHIYNSIVHKFIRKKNLNVIKKVYSEYKCIIDYYVDDIDNLESCFSRYFDEAETLYSKVYYKFMTGKYLLSKNRKDEAKVAFQYVAENGKNIFIARKSHEYLLSYYTQP